MIKASTIKEYMALTQGYGIEKVKTERYDVLMAIWAGAKELCADPLSLGFEKEAFLNDDGESFHGSVTIWSDAVHVGNFTTDGMAKKIFVKMCDLADFVKVENFGSQYALLFTVNGIYQAANENLRNVEFDCHLKPNEDSCEDDFEPLTDEEREEIFGDDGDLGCFVGRCEGEQYADKFYYGEAEDFYDDAYDDKELHFGSAEDAYDEDGDEYWDDEDSDFYDDDSEYYDEDLEDEGEDQWDDEGDDWDEEDDDCDEEEVEIDEPEYSRLCS